MNGGLENWSSQFAQRWRRAGLLLAALVVLILGSARARPIPLAQAQTGPNTPGAPGDVFSSGSNPCGPGGIYTAGPYARCDCGDPSQPCPVICWWSNSAQSVLCYPRQDLYEASVAQLETCEELSEPCDQPGEPPVPIPACPSSTPTEQEIDSLGGECSQSGPLLQGGVSENGSGEQPPISGLCPDGSEPAPDGSCPPPNPNPPLTGGISQPGGLCPDGSEPASDGSCPSSNSNPLSGNTGQQLCPDGSQPAPDGSCPPPPDIDNPPPIDPQPWPPDFQPIQPAPCDTAQEDRAGGFVWAQSCPTPAPPPPCGGVTSMALVQVLTRLCVAPSLQATVQGCITAFNGGSDSQATSIVSVLQRSAPPFWVFVLPPPAGWTRPGSATIPRQPPNDQNRVGTDAKIYFNPTNPPAYRDGVARDTCSDLIHELAHAEQTNAGTNNNAPVTLPEATLSGGTIAALPGYTVQLPQRELVGVTVENCWRAANGLPLRQYYYTGPDPVSGRLAFATLPANVANPTSCTWSGSGL